MLRRGQSQSEQRSRSRSPEGATFLSPTRAAMVIRIDALDFVLVSFEQSALKVLLVAVAEELNCAMPD
jgi:hypothetical protein